MLQQRKGFSGLRNNTDKGRVMSRNVFFKKNKCKNYWFTYDESFLFELKLWNGGKTQRK